MTLHERIINYFLNKIDTKLKGIDGINGPEKRIEFLVLRLLEELEQQGHIRGDAENSMEFLGIFGQKDGTIRITSSHTKDLFIERGK